MENNVYSTPEAELEVNDTQTLAHLASRWSRFWASILDSLILIAFMLILMYFTSFFAMMENGESEDLGYSLMLSAAGILFFLAINGYFLIRDGQTIGKKALGIKIVTMGNQQAKLSHLSKRVAFNLLVPQIPVVGSVISIIDCLFIFRKSKRCLHDQIAGTQVVDVYTEKMSDKLNVETSETSPA